MRGIIKHSNTALWVSGNLRIGCCSMESCSDVSTDSSPEQLSYYNTTPLVSLHSKLSYIYL